MKTKFLSILGIAVLAIGMISCEAGDNGSNDNVSDDSVLDDNVSDDNVSDDNDQQEETILSEHSAVVLGWGNGRASNPAYLSLSLGDGKIATYQVVNDGDEVTQSTVDLVFPGDWGNSGGGITFAAPSSSGAGGAAYEMCTNWLRKKGTRIYELPASFDLSAFESIKTENQLLALEEETSIYYSDWVYPSGGGTGKTLIVRTYEGYLALLFIRNVQGTYGDVQAKVTIDIKLTQKVY